MNPDGACRRPAEPWGYIRELAPSFFFRAFEQTTASFRCSTTRKPGGSVLFGYYFQTIRSNSGRKITL
jgi:hypothetical protein